MDRRSEQDRVRKMHENQLPVDELRADKNEPERRRHAQLASLTNAFLLDTAGI